MNAYVTCVMLVAFLLAVPAVAADPGDDASDCHGSFAVACTYDHDGDPVTQDAVCVLWAPGVTTEDCVVGA